MTSFLSREAGDLTCMHMWLAGSVLSGGEVKGEEVCVCVFCLSVSEACLAGCPDAWRGVFLFSFFSLRALLAQLFESFVLRAWCAFLRSCVCAPPSCNLYHHGKCLDRCSTTTTTIIIIIIIIIIMALRQDSLTHQGAVEPSTVLVEKVPLPSPFLHLPAKRIVRSTRGTKRTLTCTS